MRIFKIHTKNSSEPMCFKKKKKREGKMTWFSKVTDLFIHNMLLNANAIFYQVNNYVKIFQKLN